jgi:organic radical activating enzyme
MTALDTVLPVNEVFGPTWQGEGPHAGRRCYFVRLGMCNLHCSWCDTPYTWDPTRYDLDAENPDRTVAQIRTRLYDLGARAGSVIVLSGGEPFIHHHKIRALLESTRDFSWHVESNGTIAPPLWAIGTADSFSHVTLSPKVGQSDDPVQRRLPSKALGRWASLTRLHPDQIAWKFVARHNADVTAAAELVREHNVPRECAWIMPEGVTPLEVLDRQRALAPAVEAAGFNLTTRLHTLLWADKRGV